MQDGALWIYPLTKLVTLGDTSALVDYTFGSKTVVHQFCGICGVALFEKFLNPASRFRECTAINVRTTNELPAKEVRIQKTEGKSDLPLYQV
jgi:hypothetical protein